MTYIKRAYLSGSAHPQNKYWSDLSLRLGRPSCSAVQAHVWREENMNKVAVLDDWQGVARSSTDWSLLIERAEVVLFEQAFAGEDDIAARLADFDIVLSMRERTPLPASLLNRPHCVALQTRC